MYNIIGLRTIVRIPLFHVQT